MPDTRAEQAKEEFHVKQDHLAGVMEAAWDAERKKYDFTRSDVQEKLGVPDKDEALRKVKQLNAELDDLAEELAQIEAKEVTRAISDRENDRSQPVRGGEVRHPIDDNRPKTLGRMFTESSEYKALRKKESVGVSARLDIGIKTLFETTAGFPPESVRSGLIVPDVAFSLAELLDLIPVFQLDQANFVYMQETTRTHGATEVDEGGTYPESEFVFEEASSAVRKIADSIPVTDEQLEDESQVASLLDQRLRFGLRRRLATQILNGSGAGTPTQLLGILQTPNIQTHNLSGESIQTGAYKAITKARFTGQAEPSAFVFHPNDWEEVVVAQETTGNFMWVHPSLSPMNRLWGLPVALSTGIAEGSALVGDFRNFSRLDERRGVEVQAGFVGTQFVEGKQTLRADLRAAFTVTRPAAFVEIDLTA